VSKTWPPENLQKRQIGTVEGAQGAQGPRGPQGLPGAPGKPGFDSRYVSIEASTAITKGQLVSVSSGLLIVNTTSTNCIGVATHSGGEGEMIQVQIGGLATCISYAATTSGSLAAQSSTAGRVANHSSGSSVGVIVGSANTGGIDTIVMIRPEDA